MTRTLTLTLLSLALLALPGSVVAQDGPSLDAAVGASVSLEPGEIDTPPFGITPDDGDDGTTEDSQNETGDEPDERTSDNSSDDDGADDQPSIPEQPPSTDPPEDSGILGDSSNGTDENETEENETEDDGEDEPVLDPMAPTEIDTRARGPGPIDDAKLGATVHHNTSTVGVSLYEELVLEPSTGNDSADEAAQSLTVSTPVHELLWGWTFEHEDSGAILTHPS